MINRNNRQKPLIINNKCQLDINYDKLAETMIKAQEKANKEKSTVSDMFAMLTGVCFRIMSIVGIPFSILLAVSTIMIGINQMTWISGAWSIVSNCMLLVLLFLLAVVAFLFSLLLYRSAKEIEKEKDRQFVIAVFSGVTSFAAVVVALVALLN